MKNTKRIWLWILTVFLALSALVYFPSVSSLIFIFPALLILPLQTWQDMISRYINGKLKTVTVVALIIVAALLVPKEDTAIEPPQAGNTETAEGYVSDGGDARPEQESDIPPLDSSHISDESGTDAVSSEAIGTESSPSSDGDSSAPTPDDTALQSVHTHSFKAASWTEPRGCTSCEATEGQPLGHSWRNATCTSPKSCFNCPATEGAAKGHNWRSATYGSPKKCLDCSATEGSPLQKPGGENYHGHVYTGGSSSEKFHYEAHCAGKYSHEITWEEIDRRNLGPCGTCVLK